jgi:hypothetical protein
LVKGIPQSFNLDAATTDLNDIGTLGEKVVPTLLKGTAPIVTSDQILLMLGRDFEGHRSVLRPRIFSAKLAGASTLLAN